MEVKNCPVLIGLIEKLEEISNKTPAQPDGTKGEIEQNTDNPADQKTKDLGFKHETFLIYNKVSPQ